MSELPKGWAETTVTQLLADYQAGFASGKKDAVGGLKHLRMNNITVNGTLDLSLTRTVPKDLAGKRHILKEGDVVICTTNSAKLVGKVAYFDLKGEYAFSNHLTCLRTNPEGCVSRYLYYYLLHYWKQNGYEDKSKHWVNQSSLPKEQLLALPVSLAPLNEQKRIVAKLDELLPKVEACKQRLEKIPTILKRLRQSVLAAAVSGRLTEGWRKSNPHQNASALKLELVRQMANEKKPEIDAENEEWVSELREIVPPSWDVCRIGEVAKVMLGGTPSRKKPEYWNGDIPWISSGEVANCEIFDTEEKITSEGLDNSNAKLLSPGTVLVAMIGEGKTRGQSAILRVPATSNQNSASIVFDQALLLSEFVFFWMLYRYEATRSGGRGGNQPALNGEKVRQLPFVLPPTDEQREIVRLIKSELASIEKLFLSVSNANAFIDKTADAILQRAFAGALVLQDPTDEPATLLLERIKSSASTPKQRRATSGKRKAAKEPQSLSA